MIKALSKAYSKIFPQADNTEYNAIELAIRFIVFGLLIALLIKSCIYSYSLLFPKAVNLYQV